MLAVPNHFIEICISCPSNEIVRERRKQAGEKADAKALETQFNLAKLTVHIL